MLRVQALNKTYRADGGKDVPAVRDVSFEVEKGQIFTLLGPSGCGKTTTLRSIAGLETPDSGEIAIDGRPVYSSARRVRVPTSERGFGMVFQSYAIWPHMSVFENAAFPLTVPKRRGSYTRAQVKERVERVLAVVALDGYEGRKATQLSGGQQQRLALARAIVVEPPLLLLDEPLSNLDAKLRERMRFELKRLQRDLGVTTVYVTHDQSEALALSHTIAVMNEGRIVQIGPPKDIYERPGGRFVAEFIGTTNFIPGKVLGPGANGAVTIETAFGKMDIDGREAPGAGNDIVVSARPEHVRVSLEKPQGSAWQGKIETQIFLGFHQDVELRIGEVLLQARLHPSLRIESGANVYVQIDPDRCVVCQ